MFAAPAAGSVVAVGRVDGGAGAVVDAVPGTENLKLGAVVAGAVVAAGAVVEAGFEVLRPKAGTTMLEVDTGAAVAAADSVVLPAAAPKLKGDAVVLGTIAAGALLVSADVGGWAEVVVDAGTGAGRASLPPALLAGFPLLFSTSGAEKVNWRQEEGLYVP